MDANMSSGVRAALARGGVIPASPLALDRQRRFDERRQRAIWRYYAAAGAGGIAVGVHTTQFAIRDPKIGLYEPLLALAAEEFDRSIAREPSRCCESRGFAGGRSKRWPKLRGRARAGFPLRTAEPGSPARGG